MRIYINETEALKRLGGNKAMYLRLLGKFGDDGSCEQIIRLIKENRMTEAQQTAHTLKGVAGNLSLTALFDTVSAIEAAIKNGGTVTDELLSNLSEIMSETIRAIDEYA
ncbi:MAG: Hpt domain-containing protein [Oscillospiraceae bacterium]|nr:Hpt domain-containing protein [Oscillospiraceae bacterium]